MGPSVSASAGDGKKLLCSQIGRSSWTCLLISLTNASATVDVSLSSSNLRTMKLNRTCVVFSSIGVVVAMLIASTMPLNHTLEKPGP